MIYCIHNGLISFNLSQTLAEHLIVVEMIIIVLMIVIIIIICSNQLLGLCFNIKIRIIIK